MVDIMHVKTEPRSENRNFVLAKGEREMQAKSICEWCGQEYWKAKDWQRFHHPKCRDDWHNHQKKMALVEMSGFRLGAAAETGPASLPGWHERLGAPIARQESR
jgi:hypothetical protein